MAKVMNGGMCQQESGIELQVATDLQSIDTETTELDRFRLLETSAMDKCFENCKEWLDWNCNRVYRECLQWCKDSPKRTQPSRLGGVTTSGLRLTKGIHALFGSDTYNPCQNENDWVIMTGLRLDISVNIGIVAFDVNAEFHYFPRFSGTERRITAQYLNAGPQITMVPGFSANLGFIAGKVDPQSIGTNTLQNSTFGVTGIQYPLGLSGELDITMSEVAQIGFLGLGLGGGGPVQPYYGTSISVTSKELIDTLRRIFASYFPIPTPRYSPFVSGGISS